MKLSSRKVLVVAGVVVLVAVAIVVASRSRSTTTTRTDADALDRTPATDSLLATLESIPVRPEAPRAGYERSLFKHWDDEDHDGCNTRCEVLASQRRPDGTWFSEWDGYTTTDPSELEIDHVVALAEAWDSGADRWTEAQRDAFADDQSNLVAVTAGENTRKGDQDAAEWFPARADANCLWSSTVVRVKSRWSLAVDQAEHDALANLLRTCPDYVPPSTTTTVTTTTTTTTAPAAAGLAGRIVVIDPGHNEHNAQHLDEINRQVDVVTQRKACDTTGTATDDGYTEADYNTDVANRLAAVLRAAGSTVVLTRGPDTSWGPCITERAAIGNDAHADVAISIHADGGPADGRGFHVIEPALVAGHNDSIIEPSARFALVLRDTFRAETPMPVSTYIGRDGIDRRDDLGGLNLSTVPKVFIETGNMRNAADASLLSSAEFRQSAARAIADAMAAYFS